LTLIKGVGAREKKFTIRCSDEEHEYLLQVAKQKGEHKATYWRNIILKGFHEWQKKH